MKREVLIRLRGTQNYESQAPDTIELTTEGTLTRDEGRLILSYKETALTGLEGTVTSFEVQNDRVVLRRTGTVSSKMEFSVGEVHKSLYETPMGALLVTVSATKVENNLGDDGGNLTVAYAITIEDLGMGTIEYHLEVTPLD